MKKERASIYFSKGVTFIELLIIIGILVTLAAISVPAFRYFQKESDLNNSTEEIINTLRLAQSKTLSSEGASQYGVYFDDSTDPDQYTIFMGSSYTNTEMIVVEIHKVSKTIEISQINLADDQVVFDRLTGITSQTGDIELSTKITPVKTNTVYVEGSGKVGLNAPPLSPIPDTRTKDSRHVHFDYSGVISTTIEKLTLTFTYDSSTVTKEIVIADNMKDGQIYWEGEVAVNGVNQKIKIHTHLLNNPGAQFCVHRDARYNDKALAITISGDTSGNLIQYPADGSTTTTTSLYVSNILWQ